MVKYCCGCISSLVPLSIYCCSYFTIYTVFCVALPPLSPSVSQEAEFSLCSTFSFFEGKEKRWEGQGEGRWGAGGGEGRDKWSEGRVIGLGHSEVWVGGRGEGREVREESGRRGEG